MASEYERLLEQMIQEERSKLDALKAKHASARKLEEQEFAIRFVEVELQRYRQGMTLFRTKKVPKVGRWGVAETDPHASAGP